MAQPTTTDWTDHDVSDPGITLLQALAYAVAAVGVVTATVVFMRRRGSSPGALASVS